MVIPINGVRVKALRNKKRIIAKTTQIINKGIFFYGEENEKLVQNLQNFFHTPNILLTASGHDSLGFSLQALSLDKDDEILFPVNVYPTAFPICLSKGKPIPIDCDNNGLINLEEVAKKITPNTKAIVVVHLYGMVVDILKLKTIIDNKQIAIIEDCAQSFGSIYKEKPVGTLGDFGCLSFYPTKTIATLGDGGALIIKDRSFLDKIKYFLQYGEKTRYYSLLISGHSRMPEIQAGILNLYFKPLAQELSKRKMIFDWYKDFINKNNLQNKIRIVMQSDKDIKPAYHMFVIDCHKRNNLKDYLAKKGIETFVNYPSPIHLLLAFTYLGYKKGDFPIAEGLSKNILTLPFHPYLTKKQIQYIVNAIKEFYEL